MKAVVHLAVIESGNVSETIAFGALTPGANWKLLAKGISSKEEAKKFDINRYQDGLKIAGQDPKKIEEIFKEMGVISKKR